MNIKELSKPIKEAAETYRKMVQTQGESVVKEAMKEFFNENPSVLAVKWPQFTPYFNDGDECRFSVGEPYVLVRLAENEDSEDYDVEVFNDVECTVQGKWGETIKDRTISNNVAELSSFLYSLQDELKLIFGDHAEITVTPDSITIDEYDHD